MNKIELFGEEDSIHKSVEILCIGSELLLGNIVNSNACWIAQKLAALGLPHYRQTVVGDNYLRISKAMIESSKRCSLLIITGGLGPTPDDITAEAIANTFGKTLEERPEIWKEISSKMNTRSQVATDNNRKQAYFPAEAEIIPNPIGTAPGMILSLKENFTLITLPGVPIELKKMWSETVEMWINENLNTKKTFHSKILHFTGITESSLSQKVKDLMENENPTISPYASEGKVDLRLTASAENITEANKIIQLFESKLLNRLGEYFYGSNDQSLASVVIDLLRERVEKVVVAESCSGGGLGRAISAIPGSSEVFKGGIIAYSDSMKQKLLNVPIQLLKVKGAVSQEVVESMAKGALKKLEADWSIAISGIAGPAGGSKIKPIGTVFIAIAGKNCCEVQLEQFGSHKDRHSIQELSVIRALNSLRLILLAQS